MNKDYLAPLAVFALVFVGAAFLIVSAFVWISRGKSSFWTSKKLKLGAIILTLNSLIISGCMSGCYQTTCYDTADPQVMCYDMPATNVVRIEHDSLNNVVQDNKIKGYVSEPDHEEYAYAIVKDRTNDTLQKGVFKLNANDTVSYERTFSIDVEAKLTTGRYWIKIFNIADADNKYANPLESAQINIE
ncbi:MAG: hypothetical protein J5826_02430 [Bacteroidales bacterium]|nr:hypothetical protein [Bacteroidales bacterium]